jgi:hypothetical protein
MVFELGFKNDHNLKITLCFSPTSWMIGVVPFLEA